MLHKKRSPFLRVAASACALAASFLVHGQTLNKFIVTDMGALPTSTVSIPRHLNRDGMVVGSAQKHLISAPFLFDAGILYDLGVLPGRNTALANWINSTGAIVGTSGVGDQAKGFVWNNGSMTAIPHQWPTEGVGMNDSGVLLFNFDSSGIPNGSLWKFAAIYVGVAYTEVPATLGFMNATALNNVDKCVGNAFDPFNVVYTCWRWKFPDPITGAVDSPTEINPKAVITDFPMATAVNDINVWLGGTTSPNVYGMTGPYVKDALGRPTYYRPIGFVSDTPAGIVPLPMLSGDNVSECYGVNLNGLAVGRSGKFEIRNGVGTYAWKPVMWVPIGAPPWNIVIDLRGYLPQNNGIVIDNLTAINDAGQVTGTYTRAGEIRSVLLTPTLTPIGLTLDSTSIPGGFGTTGHVLIDGLAPFGGTKVTLASNNGVVAVPGTVTVPAGKDNVNFPVTTSPVAAPSSVLITASRSGYSVTITLHVNPTALDKVVVNPSVITGGTNVNGQVVLAGTAPTGGFKVNMSSNKPTVAVVSAVVTVPVTLSTQLFTIVTKTVTVNTPVIITGSANGVTRTANLLVSTPFLSVFGLSKTTCFGGQDVPGYVTLSGPARSPGAAVMMQSSAPGVAQVPASILVATGATTSNLIVHTNLIRFNTNVTLTASFNGQTRTQSLVVKGAGLVSVTITPNTVKGGLNTTGKVTLDWQAFTGGDAVVLTSSNTSVANAPTSVTVPAGQVTANFTITTTAVAANTPVTFSGTYLGVTKTATVTVTP